MVFFLLRKINKTILAVEPREKKIWGFRLDSDICFEYSSHAKLIPETETCRLHAKLYSCTYLHNFHSLCTNLNLWLILKVISVFVVGTGFDVNILLTLIFMKGGTML